MVAMWVNKIIYITPALWSRNDLTPLAKSQLQKVGRKFLAWENVDAPIAFRCIQDYHPAQDWVRYLSRRCSKTIKDIKENFDFVFLSDNTNIQEAINSTKQWHMVVVGVTQEELKNVLESCKKDWYNVINKDKINWKSSVYAISIDLKNKDKSDFFEAIYE